MIKVHTSSSGFTLFEIIIAIFIISLAIVPMMEGFRPAMMTAASVEKTAVLTDRARGTLNRMLATDFDTLQSKADAQPHTGTDVFGDSEETFVFDGISFSPEITISDQSGDSSKTLLNLTVKIDTISFTTLRADY